MNKQHYLSIAMGMLLPLFAACSSDDNLDQDSAKVDVTTRMEFPVTFADYNQDTEVAIRVPAPTHQTRSTVKL